MSAPMPGGGWVKRSYTFTPAGRPSPAQAVRAQWRRMRAEARAARRAR